MKELPLFFFFLSKKKHLSIFFSFDWIFFLWFYHSILHWFWIRLYNMFLSGFYKVITISNKHPCYYPFFEPLINKKNKKSKRENTKTNKKFWKKVKKYISVEKNILERSENYKDWLRRMKIYKIWKFDSIFSSNEDPIGKENLILRRKI